MLSNINPADFCRREEKGVVFSSEEDARSGSQHFKLLKHDGVDHFQWETELHFENEGGGALAEAETQIVTIELRILLP